MSALREAKQFVALHATHMGLGKKSLIALLDGIIDMNGDGPGSWVNVFSNEARVFASRGNAVMAANLYNLARFPVADTQAKREAGHLAATTFAGWLAESGSGERRIATLGDTQIPFLFRAGPSKSAGLVILMGGIVSLKEQWGGFLALGRKIGCAIAIADFPGVGENSLTYDRHASVIFSAIMDAVSDACDAAHTLIIAPSFGGYLAILQAASDPRIKEIVTVGAPLKEFFIGAADTADVPGITRMALASSMGVPEPDLAQQLGPLALTEDEIARIRVPVTYVAALRDEIIPAGEWQNAMRLASRFRVHAFDDVHGAPHHLRETRLVILAALMRHNGRVGLGRIIERFLRLKLLLQNPLRQNPARGLT